MNVVFNATPAAGVVSAPCEGADGSGVGYPYLTFQITFDAASLTALTVDVNGWVGTLSDAPTTALATMQIGTHAASAGELAAGYLIFHVVQKPVNFFNCVLSTHTLAGAAPSNLKIRYLKGR